MTVVGRDNGPVPGPFGEKIARVLLQTTGASAYGIDVTLSYTPTNRAVGEVRRGGLTGSMALASNTNETGVVRASLASASAVTGSGVLLTVTFPGNDPVDWHLDQVRINEGLVQVTPDPVPSVFDTDGDGLIDADEIEVFHTDPARRDTDNDGMFDGAEVRAGTDPLNKDDVFKVLKADTESGSARVTWAGKSNRTYQVLKSLDLLSWANAPDGVGPDQQSLRAAATNTVLKYVDPGAPGGAGKAFYRVRLVE